MSPDSHGMVHRLGRHCHSILRPVMRILAVLSALGSAISAAVPENPEESNLVVIPMVARSEETSWQIGGAGIYLLPEVDSSPRSNLTASALVSVRRQFTATLGVNGYLLKDRLRPSFTLDGFVWPTEFFPQDPPSDMPEKYSFAGFKSDAVLAWRVAGKLFAGPSLRLSLQDNDVDADGLMARSGLTALKGHAAAGPGLSLALDSRDIAHAPSRGGYLGGSVHYLLGLDSRREGFVDFEFSARRYLSPDSARNIFAFALELEGVVGSPPFSMMPSTDGTTVLRGIKRARYYDARMATIQAEYRRNLGRWGATGPWGATLFAEAGQFFRRLESFGERKPVVAMGAGLRYILIPSERVCLRLDVAYVDKSLGVVINALEAF